MVIGNQDERSVRSSNLQLNSRHSLAFAKNLIGRYKSPDVTRSDVIRLKNFEFFSVFTLGKGVVITGHIM